MGHHHACCGKFKNARKRMNRHPGIDLVERAKSLAPLIMREADEIERTRRLTSAGGQGPIEDGAYPALLAQRPCGLQASLGGVLPVAGGGGPARAPAPGCRCQ